MLRKMNSFVQTVALAISDTTMCNVTITDVNHTRIAGTGPYETRIGEKAPMGSAFEEACRIKGTIIIDQPKSDEICKNCSGVLQCVEHYEICTPILREGNVLGVIGIFANNEVQKNYIKQRNTAFRSYIENMSKLLSSYMVSEELLMDNRSKKNELEAIIEYTNHAVLCLDNKGHIKYLNTPALELFHMKKQKMNYIGLSVMESVGESNLFRRAIYTTEPLLNVEDIVNCNGNLVTVSATVNRMYEEGKLHSIVISAMDSRALQAAAIRQRESKMDTSFESLIGTGELMQKVIHKARIAAAYDSTILITGESGTGKELFARAIHRESPRSNAPFISINCSAIPESLLESELFGYESGAFTGASEKGKLGKMELANHGTFFLDEIGDMSLFLQTKLLRVIQEKRIMKIGGTEYLDLDIRIIAATNQNLEELIAKQEFREDLYYRLNVIPLALPSLRQRKSDIPEIANYFLEYFNRRFGKSIVGFSQDAMKALESHKWKGNVRELENVVEYLVNFSLGPEIDLTDVLMRLGIREKEEESLEGKVREFEKRIIRELLQEYGSDARGKEKVAEKLQISLATLYRKLN